jgi:hypothetical protein
MDACAFLAGVCALSTWSGVLSTMIFYLLKRVSWLRVNADDEQRGKALLAHACPHLLQSMSSIRQLHCLFHLVMLQVWIMLKALEPAFSFGIYSSEVPLWCHANHKQTFTDVCL